MMTREERRKSWIGFHALVLREIQRFLSVFTQTVIPPVVSSFLYIFIFGFSVGRQIGDVGGISYLSFLIPGLIMMYVVEGSYVNASSSFFISRWANHVEEILVSPLSYIEMVLANLIGGLTRVSCISLGVYLVSLIFVRMPIAHPFIVLFFVVFVSLTFSSTGLIVALFAEEFEHLSIVTTFLITPLVFFGGVFHSIAMVPEPLRWISGFNPIYYMVCGMRYGMLGFSDAPVLQCALVTMVFFVTMFSVTVYLFKIGFKLRK